MAYLTKTTKAEKTSNKTKAELGRVFYPHHKNDNKYMGFSKLLTPR